MPARFPRECTSYPSTRERSRYAGADGGGIGGGGTSPGCPPNYPVPQPTTITRGVPGTVPLPNVGSIGSQPGFVNMPRPPDPFEVISRGKWDFEVDPGPLGRPIDLRKLARGSRTVLAICAVSVLGGFLIGSVWDAVHVRSQRPDQPPRQSPFHGGSGGLALGLAVCAGAAAVNALYQSTR